MKTIGKQILAMFLCILLFVSMLPVNAWAEENGSESGTNPDGAGVENTPEEDPSEPEQPFEIGGTDKDKPQPPAEGDTPA